MNGNHPTEDILIAQALDELDAPGREEVTAHLAGCERCTATAARLASAIGVYRSADLPEASAGVLVDLLDAQAAQGNRGLAWGWFRQPLRLAAAAAAILALFLSGFWTGRVSDRPVSGAEVPEARSTVPHPLPDPPTIDFRAEPPMAVWFATARGPNGNPPTSGGLRDSL
jgi:anti-sigma factor RsiW